MSIEWDGKGFPPVGTEIKTWDDESSTYRKGVVVYSGRKGATVDVGFLLSSGEQGDFSLITAEDRLEEVAINAMLEQADLATKTAERLYSRIKRGEIPGIRLTDDAGS